MFFGGAAGSSGKQRIEHVVTGSWNRNSPVYQLFSIWKKTGGRPRDEKQHKIQCNNSLHLLERAPLGAWNLGMNYYHLGLWWTPFESRAVGCRELVLSLALPLVLKGQKKGMESRCGAGGSQCWIAKQRGEDIKEHLDLIKKCASHVPREILGQPLRENIT